MLVKAVQELSAKNDALETRMAALEAIADIRRRNKCLKKL